ncbi:Protein trapped in endoderm-1 [Operophtera brumata]|uniref:Protein trapped in endoderm-1 n=1 Tax=Operophtera brumata TaxID=104452 RepID=A0A0L7LL27_OPEBR|nr:Protein trapped in endoderm-1 [Operophtera brumata]
MNDNWSMNETVSRMEGQNATFYPTEATILAAVCACIFSVVGVVGNLVTTVALLMHPKLRTHVTTMFVLSLCVSDLLFCSINLPLTANRYIQQHWGLGPQLCQMFAFVFYGNEAVSLLSMVAITINSQPAADGQPLHPAALGPGAEAVPDHWGLGPKLCQMFAFVFYGNKAVSLLSLVAITINRYTLIAYYDMYSQIYTTTKIWVQLLMIWLVSFGLMDGMSPKKYLFVFGFALPCVVIIVSYSCIYWKVRESKRKLEGRSKLSGQTAKEKEEDSRLTTLMLTIFLCFLACFLPLMIMNVADDGITYPWLHVIASILAWASSVVNPLIYAATNRQYRAAYGNLLKLCKNNPVTRRTTWGSRTVGQSSNSPNYGEKRCPKDRPTNL